MEDEKQTLKNSLPGLTNMFKNRFLLIDFFGLVLAGTTSILFRAELSQAQEPPPKDVRHISLLVEQGFTLPAPSLARLNSGDVSDATGLIVAEAVRLPQQRSKEQVAWRDFHHFGGCAL